MQKGDRSESSDMGMVWMWWSPRCGDLRGRGSGVFSEVGEAVAERAYACTCRGYILEVSDSRFAVVAVENGAALRVEKSKLVGKMEQVRALQWQ